MSLALPYSVVRSTSTPFSFMSSRLRKPPWMLPGNLSMQTRSVSPSRSRSPQPKSFSRLFGPIQAAGPTMRVLVWLE